MKKYFNQVIAIIVTIAVTFSGMQIDLNAKEAEMQQSQSEVVTKEAMENELEAKDPGRAVVEMETAEPTVVRELEDERTLNSSTYLLSNGMKKSVYYAGNVRYEDEEGNIEEYDPELVSLKDDGIDTIADVIENANGELERKQLENKIEKEYLYQNNRGDSKQYFPKQMSQSTPIVMVKETYKVSFTPNNIEEYGTQKTLENINAKSSVSVDLAEKVVTDYKETTENKKVIAKYDYYNSDIILEYQSLEQGVKENIILNKVPEDNIFTYVMTLENMEARVDREGGGITFYDIEKDAITGGIAAPFMNDASNEAYSEEVYYELELLSREDNVNKYQLSVIVDEGYLSDENRQYPVTIDPTISWTGVSDFPETYVFSGDKDFNYFSSGVKALSVGKNSSGTYRTYFRAMELSDTVSGRYVESATVTLYENGNSTTGTVIEIRRATDSFQCKSINWDNKPGYGSNVFDTLTVTNNTEEKHELDVTTWARNIANGKAQNYGLVLKAQNESSSSYAKFYGCRTDSTSYKSKLTVVHYDPPTQPSSVTVDDTYLKAGERLTVNWSDIDSQGLDYVNYRIANYDAVNNQCTSDHISYSVNTNIGTTSDGKSVINASIGWPEGHYKVFVRGVDEGGIAGLGRGAQFIIDKTAPEIANVILSNSYGNTVADDGAFYNERPTLTWSVSEKYLDSIQISINGGIYNTISTSNTGAYEIYGLESGCINDISIKAVDRAGNETIENVTYGYDYKPPVITGFSTNPLTSEQIYSNVTNPTVTYSVTDDNLYSVGVYVNKDYYEYIEDSAVVEHEQLEVTSYGETLELADYIYEGENEIYIETMDWADNMSYKRIYYNLDTVPPTLGTIKTLPRTSEGAPRSKYPTIRWNGCEDENLKEIQVSINGSEYKAIGTTASGEALLLFYDLYVDGKNSINVRVVDKAGNASEIYSSEYYLKYTASPANEYVATNIHVMERLNGNSIISFSNAKNDFPGDIAYEVHRSTEQMFTPSSETCIAKGGENGIIEVEGDVNTTYYYKLRAYALDGQPAYSDYSYEFSSTTLSGNELTARAGVKDLHDYHNFETPNGSGAIELSKGNFVYSQADLSLPSAQIPVVFSRVYNSNSSETTGLGKKWASNYEMYISKDNVSDTVMFVDESRAIYTFKKENDKYVCEETKDITLEVESEGEEKVLKYSSPDDNQISTEKIIYYYVIENKENDKIYFDICGRLIVIEEANGTFVSVKYNKLENTISHIKTSNNMYLTFLYRITGTNNEKYITGIHLQEDKNDGSYLHTFYSYEYQNDLLTKVIFHGKEGGQIVYEYRYDENGNLCDIVDAEGNVYTIEYASGKVACIKYPEHKYENIHYTSSATCISIGTYDNGVISEYNTYKYFDDKGRLIKEQLYGNTYEYKYTEDNSLKNEYASVHYSAIEENTVVTKTDQTKDVVTYNKQGNVTRVETPEGYVTEYAYSEGIGAYNNFPVQVTQFDPDGNIIVNLVNSYDNAGNIVKQIDIENSIVAIYEYDEYGNVSASTGTIVSNVTDFVHISVEEIKAGLQSYKNTATVTADGTVSDSNQVAGTVNTGTVNTYDSVGRVLTTKEGKITVVDGKNTIADADVKILTEYIYDEFGRLIETKTTSNGKTSSTKSEYDKNGTLVKSTDTVGRETYYTYDSLNRLIEEKLKAGDKEKITKTEYEYVDITDLKDGSGTDKTVLGAYHTTVKNEESNVVSETYVNYRGQVVRELKDGISYDYTYDISGHLFTSYVNGASAGVEDDHELSVSVYDKNDNLTNTIINPGYRDGKYVVTEDSLVSTNKYDISGNLIETTSPEGRSIKYQYDEQGRITDVNIVNGDNDTSNEMTYKYDIENIMDGKLTSVSEKTIDALGRCYETVYNGAGQMLETVQETDNGAKKVKYEYDERGNLTKTTYADGRYITYNYDDMGYVKTEITHNTTGYPQEIISNTYDDEYNLIEVVTHNDFKPVCYSYNRYDEFGRVVGTASIYSNSKPTEEQIEEAMLTYEYNINDDVIAMYYPDNSVDAVKGVYYEYNEFNWITDIYAIMSDESKNIVRHYEYASDGKVQEIHDYSDFISGSTNYMRRQYSYDVYNRVTSMIYTYSDSPNVILEKYEYTYDKDSNVLSEHVVNLYEGNCRDITTTYEYDKMERLVQSTEVNNLTFEEKICTYEYDKVSNRTKKIENGVETVYTYNKLNQMVKSVETDGANSYTTTYEYDNNGNQTKIVDGKTGATTTNTYDVYCQLRSVTITKDGEETKTQQNVYNDEGQRISKTENGVKTYYYYEGSNVIYTTDGSGNKTTLNIYGVEENVVASVRYEDDGQHSYSYSKDIQSSTYAITDEDGFFVVGYEYGDFGETEKIGESTFYNEICYTGAVYDEMTGLHYLNARYYNPDEAVFLSKDS